MLYDWLALPVLLIITHNKSLSCRLTHLFQLLKQTIAELENNCNISMRIAINNKGARHSPLLITVKVVFGRECRQHEEMEKALAKFYANKYNDEYFYLKGLLIQ